MSYSGVAQTARPLVASGLIWLALLSLTGCASEQRVIVRTERVEVPVEVVKPLPEGLTQPIPRPEPLPAQYTVEDVFDLIDTLYDLLDRANADREAAGKLTRPSPP